jgi:pyrroline-5-carboxylate reductase
MEQKTTKMKTKSLGFIGGGRITRIFLQAFVNKKAIFDSISVFDNNPETLQLLQQKFPFIQILETASEAARKDIVFLALHPPVIMETLEKINNAVSQQTIFISLAPKITIAKMASVLKPVQQIVRLIPNDTSVINHGSMYHSGMNAEEVMNLIPVKPIGESETLIKGIYQEKLTGLFEKIIP